MTNSNAGPTADRSRFWRRHALWPGLVFLAAAVALETSDLDLRVAGRFFDRERGVWTWGDSWWADRLIHRGGRDLIAAIGILAIAGWAASFFVARARRLRRPGAFVALTIIFGTGLVAVLKKTTNVDCPWDMEPFGGDRPFVRVFEDRPDDLPRGGCFPGGHSSGGFSLLSFYFLFDQRGRGWRVAALTFALLIGLVFSFGQWARGAHFPSHDLWSVAICWLVALTLYAGPFRFRILERPS